MLVFVNSLVCLQTPVLLLVVSRRANISCTSLLLGAPEPPEGLPSTGHSLPVLISLIRGTKANARAPGPIDDWRAPRISHATRTAGWIFTKGPRGVLVPRGPLVIAARWMVSKLARKFSLHLFNRAWVVCFVLDIKDAGISEYGSIRDDLGQEF